MTKSSALLPGEAGYLWAKRSLCVQTSLPLDLTHLIPCRCEGAGQGCDTKPGKILPAVRLWPPSPGYELRVPTIVRVLLFPQLSTPLKGQGRGSSDNHGPVLLPQRPLPATDPRGTQKQGRICHPAPSQAMSFRSNCQGLYGTYVFTRI